MPTEQQRQQASDMTSMLRGLGLMLEGRHHSGIDDCRNIANVVRALVLRGAVIECTTGGGAAASATRNGGQARNRHRTVRRARLKHKAERAKGRKMSETAV